MYCPFKLQKYSFQIETVVLLLCLIHHQTDLLAKISSLTSMHFYPVEVASQKVLWSGDIHVVHKTEARVVLNAFSILHVVCIWH